MLYDVTVAAVNEFFSCVWVEAVLFSFAAMTYLAVSGRVVVNKRQQGELRDCTVAKGAKAASSLPGSGMNNESELMQIFASLRRGRLQEAIALLRQLPDEKMKAMSDKVIPKLLTVAATAADAPAAAALVHGAFGRIRPQMLDMAMLEAQRKRNARLCGQLDRLAKLLCIPRSDITFTTLAWSYASDAEALKELMHQASVPLTKAFAKAVLQACAATKNVELVVEIFERADPADAAALRSHAEQIANRARLAYPCDKVNVTEYDAAASVIQECGQSKDLEGAIAEFEQHPLVRGHMGEKLLKKIVQACISCGNWNMAKKQILKAQQHGVRLTRVYAADMIKSLLAANDHSSAELLLHDAVELGLRIPQACYHGVLQVHALAGDRDAAWRLVADMRSAALLPNQVSCSILLKMVSSPAHAVDLSKIIDLAESMRLPADDVLLCSITEACLRVGRLDLLSHATALGLSKIGGSGGPTLSAPLYGAMIKGFGRAGEVDRVWALWHEMQSKDVEPTEITLGCMVESLVANSEADAAWKLVQDIWQDQGQRHLVNTVIYSTLMKGFTAQPDKVEAMYLEMRERRIECNTITYNTILNHFAQNRIMHRLPQILEDMRASTPPVEPDIVTYSTIIKGFCASGNLDQALELQKEMLADGKFMPDEMMYNSLLDGCAREHRLSDALRLVDEMRNNRVRPSNYTLNMLVKLLGRCKKLGKAFSVVDQLSAEFGFRPSIQVYTCLIQACFQNRQPAKAMSLLDRIFEHGLCPDQKTYVALVRGHLQMGLLDTAVELVHLACQGEQPAAVDSQCLGDVLARLGERSKAAAAMKTLVEEAWRRQRATCRQVSRQAVRPQPESKMKARVRSGRDNGSGHQRAESQVFSAAEAPKLQEAKHCKRTSSSESRASTWSSGIA
eukprot:CAMPEP_0172829918 /NCGR_PEP_ID=MMETSP1075-20121228/21867_1 /TAXON_ID=2916 /ORGANISM="Ceratium fusus, Strain PA161109" /LENGTH=904 /DNA_ID=CAMNT_0013672125 /DNA_START=1 /DNA_END=2711 /DNA_ORIENTATION=+